MVTSTNLRRVPTQKRGQERVEQILAAAVACFIQDGYAATSTNAIAAYAGISIGSLYQFFPNKEAIFAALAQSYLEKLRALLDNEFVPKPTLTAQFDCFVEAMVRFYDANPGFKPIFFSPQQTEENMAALSQVLKEITRRVAQALAVFIPTAAPADCELQATMLVLAMKGMLPQLTEPDSEKRSAAVVEIKRMVLAYVTALTEAESRE